MSSKLEKLSPEQHQKMLEVKQFWLDYIFSCKNSINQEQAKAGIEWVYQLAKLKKPIVIFVQSPLGIQIANCYVKEIAKQFPKISVWASVRDSVWDSVRASVGDSVRDSVWDSVRDSVRDSVWDSVRDSVGDSVWDSVRDSVRASVRDSVGDSVRASVGDSVWDSVRASVRASVGASVGASVRDSVWDSVRASVGASVGDSVRDSVRDSLKANYVSYGDAPSVANYGWVSFFDFFTTIGVVNHERFNQFKNILLSGIYDTIQLEGCCIVSDMPSRIVRNAQGRLHNPTGPAIEFKDGYKIYYINGRNLPSWIWEKADQNTITREMFVKETNADIKGGIYSVLGQKKMMDMLGAKVIDKKIITHANKDVEQVTLLKTETTFKEIGNKPFAWVKMICPSTGTQYLQGVEPHHTNALEAIASLSPFKSQDYSFHHRS